MASQKSNPIGCEFSHFQFESHPIPLNSKQKMVPPKNRIRSISIQPEKRQKADRFHFETENGQMKLIDTIESRKKGNPLLRVGSPNIE